MRKVCGWSSKGSPPRRGGLGRCRLKGSGGHRGALDRSVSSWENSLIKGPVARVWSLEGQQGGNLGACEGLELSSL